MRWALFILILASTANLSAAENLPNEADVLGRYLAAHGYGVVRVVLDDQNDELLVVKINGQKVTLKVDTGAVHTVISTNCARDLNLDVRATKFTDYGVGGAIKGQDGEALVRSFTINNYEINRLNLITVLPKSANFGRCEGLFGFDNLRANAVLLPVGARVLLFKPGGGAVPSIDKFMTDLGFKAVPIKYEKGGLRIEGHLNGQPLRAVVDCGAALSTFNISFVTDKARIMASYLGNLRLTGVDGRVNDAFSFVPQSLDFGSFVFQPSELIACSMPTANRLGCDALLGYDLLAAHQAIIDLGHNTLWMK